MKGRKSILVITLSLTIVFLTACGSVKDKIAEKTLEKVIEKSTGAKVDIQEGGGVIKTGDGSFQSGENMKWPKEKMGDLPEPKAKITVILSDDKTKACSVGYSSMKLEDAKKFIEDLKKLGYESVFEVADDDGMMFSGSKEDGTVVNITHGSEGNDGMIIYTKEDTSSTS